MIKQYFSAWTWARDILENHFEGDESKITGPMLIRGNQVIEEQLIKLKNGQVGGKMPTANFRDLISRTVITEALAADMERRYPHPVRQDPM